MMCNLKLESDCPDFVVTLKRVGIHKNSIGIFVNGHEVAHISEGTKDIQVVTTVYESTVIDKFNNHNTPKENLL